MKIALLTLPLHANYGGVLQAFALKTVLERLRPAGWARGKHPHTSATRFGSWTTAAAKNPSATSS